ncbi:MAG: GNAT family N-acetyltransferase [Gammaproteobacteria bacterium]
MNKLLGGKIMLIEYLADRPDLIPELAELHLAEWGHLKPDQALQDRVAALNGCTGKSSIPLGVVATNGNELLGSALLVAHDMSTRQDLSPWLAGVFVKPACRKMGVATELIQRIESEASALRIHRLYLYTDKESDFYAKRGWSIHDACEYRGLAVTVMFKNL